jgi:putative transposase
MTKELLAMIEVGSARILNATISEEAGRWFVAFGFEVERNDAPARLPDTVVGVGLGVAHLATLSTGDIVDNPTVLNRYQSLQRLGWRGGQSETGKGRP